MELTGQYAFIPDFSLEKNDKRISVEIIGFWTPEYLKNKIQKINQLTEKEDLILLVDKNLACSSSEFKTDNLILYDGKIPYLEILKILRKYEERQVTEDVEKLKNLEIALEPEIPSFVGYQISKLRKSTSCTTERPNFSTVLFSLYVDYENFGIIKYMWLSFTKRSLCNPESQVRGKRY